MLYLTLDPLYGIEKFNVPYFRPSLQSLEL